MEQHTEQHTEQIVQPTPTPTNTPVASAPITERGWIRVTNLVPSVTQEELVNLFGFCGYVSGVTIFQDPAVPNQNVAIVEFWDKNAAVTACLLSSAVIQNQPIQVELYIASATDQQNISTSNARTQGPPPVGQDPAAQQSRTATVARALASGLVMANDVKNKAIAWDSGNLSLIQKAEVLGLQAQSNVEELNRRYHITDTVEDLVKIAGAKLQELKTTIEANPNYQVAKSKALEIDNQYGISTTAFSLFEKAKTTALDFTSDVAAEYSKKATEEKKN